MSNNNQAYNPHHQGQLAWNEEYGVPSMRGVRVFSPQEINPPPGVKSMEWIESWDV